MSAHSTEIRSLIVDGGHCRLTSWDQIVIQAEEVVS